MEDKKISEMAELLCKGAKMLSHYCPECGVPLFKEGDRIFCPSCGKTAVFEDEIKLEREKEVRKDLKLELDKADKLNKDKLNKLDEPNTKEITKQEYDLKKAKNSVKNAIIRVCLKMEEEEDISSLLKMIEAVEKLISIYNNLKTVV